MRKYCAFLREKDPCVAYTMDEKARRPFVGVVFKINNMKYYAPLSSPKPKHRAMKNQLDFLKISGGELGAINFNNMIPIHSNSIECVDIQGIPDKGYKSLLENQLSWCNSNREAIVIKAEKLYCLMTNDNKSKNLLHIAKRCCNFKLNEERYAEYCRKAVE